jgi:L-threonylcarbamoyladenylate synthase
LTYSAQTRVLIVDPKSPDPGTIRDVARALRAGKLVAFPTETVYGLGANALDSVAIDNIYKAKERPLGDPVIAHIHDPNQLDLLAIDLPKSAYRLAQRFWPGPLTLVLRRAPDVPANLATGRDTVAVRMPAHPVALALLKAARVPVAAPSANTFSRPSATTAAHVVNDLNGRVDIVLDGGATTIGLESTVLDLTGDQPVILRPGGLIIGDLRTVTPDVTIAPGYASIDEHETSPGRMLKHYSPRAKVSLYSGALDAVLESMRTAAMKSHESGYRVGVLVADEDGEQFSTPTIVRTLGPRQNLAAISHDLFAGLRDLDAQSVDVILTRDFGREGIGTALWDRLVRAAEGRVILVG